MLHKFTSISLLLIWLIAGSFAGTPKKTIVVFKHGSRLFYEIEKKDSSFKLTVTFRKLEPDVVFSYEMEPDQKIRGVVTIPAQDMDSARILHNSFSGGSIKLNHEIALFLSRAVYAEIAMAGMNDNGATFVAAPNEAMDTFSMGEPTEWQLGINGNRMQLDADKFYDYVDPVHGNYHYTFTVLKNEDYPLILEMNAGWHLHLRSMDNVEIKKVDKY